MGFIPYFPDNMNLTITVDIGIPVLIIIFIYLSEKFQHNPNKDITLLGKLILRFDNSTIGKFLSRPVSKENRLVTYKGCKIDIFLTASFILVSIITLIVSTFSIKPLSGMDMLYFFWVDLWCTGLLYGMWRAFEWIDINSVK